MLSQSETVPRRIAIAERERGSPRSRNPTVGSESLKDAPEKVAKVSRNSKLSLPHRLDKRDFVDLLQRGHSQPHFIERRFTQEAHAFFARGPPDFRRRFLGQNHLAHPVA